MNDRRFIPANAHHDHHISVDAFCEDCGEDISGELELRPALTPDQVRALCFALGWLRLERVELLSRSQGVFLTTSARDKAIERVRSCEYLIAELDRIVTQLTEAAIPPSAIIPCNAHAMGRYCSRERGHLGAHWLTHIMPVDPYFSSPQKGNDDAQD